MKNSNLRKCPDCNSSVEINDKFCRVCGHNFSKDDDYSSEGKTFEDFLLEASKFRSRTQDHKLGLTEDEELLNSYEENPSNEKNRYHENKYSNQDTTDRLNVVDTGSESLKEERKKAYQRTNNGYEDYYDYYDYNNDKSPIIKKIILSVVGTALLTDIVFGIRYIKPMFQEDSTGRTITAESVKAKFMQSMQSEPSEQIINVIRSPSQSIPFKDRDTEKLISEIGSNPEHQATILKWLKDDEAKLESNRSYKSTNPIKMVKGNDEYKILINPIKPTMENPISAKLSVENASEYVFTGKKVLVIESNDLALRQDFDLSFFSKNNTTNWDTADISKSLPDFDVTSGDENYEIRKAIDGDRLVYVNDKDTGPTTDNFNDRGKKSLTEDQDFVRIVARGKSGLLKSPRQTVG